MDRGVMKAIMQRGYGTPDVLALADVERPVPGEGDVLVRVHAASIHVGDAHIMRGKPPALRLMMGLRRPRNPIPGSDIAGTVEEVGATVTGLKPGDAVFGWCKGAFAEYACAPEGNFTAKPDGVGFAEASAVGVSAFTALHAVRDQAGVEAGHKVLVNGASGGVGPFAVQIAKVFGAEVTGVCSTGKVDMVRSIGADHVIDYTADDFTRGSERYDRILDIVWSHPLSDLRRVLTPEGKVIPIGGPPKLSHVFRLMVLSMFVRQLSGPFVSMPNREDLVVLADLVGSGKVRPVVDRAWPLSEAREAMAYVAEGHAKAKVVLDMGAPG